MKASVVAVASVLALTGIGVAAMPLLQDAVANRIEAELERDGSVRVGTVDVDFLGRGVSFRDLTADFQGGFTADSLEVKGLSWPLRELLRGRMPFGRFEWGEPLFAGHVRLANIRIGHPEAGDAWTIGKLVIDDLDLQRYDVAYQGIHRDQTMAARLLGALSMARFEATDVGYTSIGDGAYSAARLGIEGYERGLLARFDIEDFQSRPVKSRAVTFSVGRVEAGGVDLRRLLRTVSSVDWEPGVPIGRIPVTKASASGFGGEILARYGLSVGAVAMETVRENPDISRTQVRIADVVLTRSLRSVEALEIRMVMQAMDLREARLDFDCSGIHDRARHEVTMGSCVLSAPDLAKATFTSQVTDADEEFWRVLDEGDVLALLGSEARLATARLVIEDGSLLRRGFQAKAMLSGRTASVERAALAAEIRGYQPSDVLITQDMTKLFDTVARFVEQGGTLTIEASPQPPLRFERIDYLLTPGADLVAALGLSARLSR